MQDSIIASIVVCHHVGNLIEGCLKSLKYQLTLDERLLSNTETIVVTSTGRSFDECITIHEPALPATKRNIGVSIAKGRYIIFLDDDVELDDKAIAYLIAGLDYHPDYGMAYGKLYNMEHRTRLDEAGGFLTWTGFIWSRAGQNIVDEGQYDTAKGGLTPIFSGKSALCIVRKDLYIKLGGMDESFGILGEESDLSWRIWKAGYKVGFTSEAYGYHAFNTKYKPVKKHYTLERVHHNGCRNYLMMLVKNLEVNKLWILLVNATVWFIVACAMAFTGKPRAAFHILSALWYVLIHLPTLLRKRGINQVTSDRDIEPFIWHSPPRGYYLQRFTRYLSVRLHG